MRTLFLLRGCPGVGKDYWVDQNGLRPYTISADDIRLMYQGPVLNECGEEMISQDNDGEVWSLLLKLLEARMSRGEFIVVNATHYRNSLITRYKDLIHKYRYRAYVVDFSDVPLETILERNRTRDAFKFVPEEHIRKVYGLLQIKNKPQSYAKLITRDEAVGLLHQQIYDYNGYKNVYIFGDIHGCYEPLDTFFKTYPFSENNAYIFTGDYIDRGIQNKEVLKFLMGLAKHKNVLLLEGNHEHHLRLYANDETSIEPVNREDAKILKKYNRELLTKLNNDKVRSHRFITETVEQIKDISRKDLRTFCDKLAQMAYITFRGKNYFISHGGIPCLPTIFTPTYQLIHGVGKYEDTISLYEQWSDKDTVLVHAHRNVLNHPIKVEDNIYNLCDEIENGGNLRILNLHDSGVVIPITIKNNVYAKQNEPTDVDNDSLLDEADLIVKQLNESKYVRRKDFGDISSYNFTQEAFKKGKWNEQTCKARGLFVYNDTNEVALRSYCKFFNDNEREETKLESLRNNLVFPLHCYRKENGFLALISYDHNNDKMLFASKSSLEGDYVEYIKSVYDKLPQIAKDGIESAVKQNNVTLVFECVCHKDNTHPIWYENEHLYLLDIVHNSFKFQKVAYSAVKAFADTHGIEVKELVATFNDFEEFYRFKKSLGSMSPNTKKPSHEGFVFEDATGFMFKYKLPFYRYWKSMRGMLNKLQGKNRTEAESKMIFREEGDVKVFGILSGIEDLSGLTIVDVEKMFYGDELVPVDRKD